MLYCYSSSTGLPFGKSSPLDLCRIIAGSSPHQRRIIAGSTPDHRRINAGPSLDLQQMITRYSSLGLHWIIMSVVISFFSHHATYTHICTHSFTPHAWTAKLSCLLVAQSGTFSFADAKRRVTVLIIILLYSGSCIWYSLLLFVDIVLQKVCIISSV